MCSREAKTCVPGVAPSCVFCSHKVVYMMPCRRQMQQVRQVAMPQKAPVILQVCARWSTLSVSVFLRCRCRSNI